MSKYIVSNSVRAERCEATEIEIYCYNEAGCVSYPSFEEYTRAEKGENCTVWINMDGLADTELIRSVCQRFGIHELVVEDIFHTSQRAKIEDHGDSITILAKMMYYKDGELVNEQESVFIGKDFVITVGERRGDVFQKIREHLQNSESNVRKNKADFLAYLLLDSIVDGYFDVLETLGDRIDESEDSLLSDPDMETLHSLKEIKKDLLYLHKSIWPLRDIALWLERDRSTVISPDIREYVRDLYDHIMGAIDTTETFRELDAGLRDLYLSSVSNKLNNVMKVLTIISTIFIPLTFIAGVYGMNFVSMPELTWKWGYAAVMALMAVIAVLMIMFFKKKKWF